MSLFEDLSVHVCRCCFSKCYTKDLWSAYDWMDEQEIYGVMLKDCFNITFPKYEEYDLEHICEACINQLRKANIFKKQVEACQQKLYQHIRNGTIDNVSGNQCKSELSNWEQHASKDNNSTLNSVEEECIYSEDYFGDCDIKSDTSQNNVIKCCNDKSKDKDAVVMKRKQSSPISKIGKNEQCNNKKVPLKQVKFEKCNKTKKDNTSISTKRSRTATREKENIGLILEYSTVCPFKSSKGHFNCFYCNKPFVVFEELRKHTENDHREMNSIDIRNSIDRPQGRMVKADVSQIICRICLTRLENLQSFVDHLTIHNKTFDTRAKIKPTECILGFILKNDKYICSICDVEFKFFKNLSKHMNEHTFNNVCDVCGKCFLMPERLRAHSKLHENNTVKCQECGKEFSSSVLLRSHARYSHTDKKFMCSLCQESFKSYRLRIEHLVQVHKIRRPEFKCDVCGKTFRTSGSLNYHVKSEHLKIKRQPKYTCEACNKCFTTMFLLKSHMLVHTGERNHECNVCHKKYSRAKTLKEHIRIHLNDRRFSCRGCGQSFIQKCSLKNHIRVHHPESNVDEMILCKNSCH